MKNKDNQIFDNSIHILLTEYQKIEIKNYCKEKNIKLSNLIRTLLIENEVITKEKFNPYRNNPRTSKKMRMQNEKTRK